MLSVDVVLYFPSPWGIEQKINKINLLKFVTSPIALHMQIMLVLTSQQKA